MSKGRHTKQIPKLMRSFMTDTVYIITKYTQIEEGAYLVDEKFEVTDEDLRKLKLKKV
jgi:hypothetical protein